MKYTETQLHPQFPINNTEAEAQLELQSPVGEDHPIKFDSKDTRNELCIDMKYQPAKSTRRKLLLISGIVAGLALAGFFFFLLAEFTIQHTRDADLKSIPKARAYFDDKNNQNLLLVQAVLKEHNIELTFEGTQNSVRLSMDIVSSFQTNGDTWLAYVTYTDDTKQEIPYLGNTIDVDDTDITLNPNSSAPLTAMISFQTKVPGKIKINVVGINSESYNLTHSFNIMNKVHNIPVFGLYEDHNNVVILSFTDAYGNERRTKTLAITTGAKIASTFSFNIQKESTYGNPFFVECQGIVYDEQGYVRWYLKDAITTLGSILINNIYSYPLSNGLLAWQVGTQNKTFFIQNKFGALVQTVNLTVAMHHEIIEKTPGGNLLVGSAASGSYEDGVQEIDRATGAVVKEWDLRNYFDKTRPQRDSHFGGINPVDWFHLNAIVYDPTDNTLLLSSRHQCIVAKIGYDDGTVKYITGTHDDWTASYSKYLLSPTNFNTDKHKDQDWTYFQHRPIILPNGNIMIYDDGGARPGYTNDPKTDRFQLTGSNYFPAYNPVPPGYARAVEYSIDQKAMTITKVWEYADFPNLITTIIGSVEVIGDDYVLIGYGELGVWSLVHKPSSTTVLRMQGPLFYRVHTIDLYEGY